MTENHQQIQSFVEELAQFAQVAEETLEKIEADKQGNKGLFSVFSERMVAIRGTAQQLSMPHIAHIAGLGEEIAVKGQTADTRPQIRKCIGALWDALTTVQHLLKHYDQETAEEQDILINRLEKTIEAFGGKRESVDSDEIEALLAEEEKQRG